MTKQKTKYVPLKADQIDFRVQSNTDKGAKILAYKDARCDMKILDDLYGKFGWKKSYELINGNLFCSVSVKDPDSGEWISKQDVGTESRTEKEKGQASDAFKRACFNWGIGRELYDFPSIWINFLPNESPIQFQRRLKKLQWKVEYDKDNRVSYLGAVDRENKKLVYEYKAS